jgi:hypothetical protein
MPFTSAKLWPLSSVEPRATRYSPSTVGVKGPFRQSSRGSGGWTVVVPVDEQRGFAGRVEALAVHGRVASGVEDRCFEPCSAKLLEHELSAALHVVLPGRIRAHARDLEQLHQLFESLFSLRLNEVLD